MTAPAWIGYAVAVAALVGALSVIWTKVIHPLIKAFSRLLELLDTLTSVLTEWPDTQLTVQGHSAELTAMGLHLGEIRAEHKEIKRDVDNLWRHVRDGSPLPALPGAGAKPRRQRRAADPQT